MTDRQSSNDRLHILLRALTDENNAQAPADGSADAVIERLAPFFVTPPSDFVWLALGVLRAHLPVRDEVIETRRRMRVEGPRRVLKDLAARPIRRGLGGTLGARPVRVVRDSVMVDVHHTARTGLATGIQRVVRKTIDEWVKAHEVVFVGWSSTYEGLRELTTEERENALYGTHPHAEHARTGYLTIPWRSHYILPELAIEPERTSRIACLAEFSGNATALIGFDCVPLTSGETVAGGMGAAFARNLVAAAQFDKVAAISQAAASEYKGWRRMQSSAGIAGPEIRDVFLPIEAGSVTEQELAEVASALSADEMPLLLCVGSHEPRKNHDAVLYAAEALWNAGRRFGLVFIGGNAWGNRDFTLRVEQLAELGQPVRTISSVTDQLLWGAYRCARATVFPSWNEGFGLPVAESIATGTPVVTSDFGSMREIAGRGGALLVDPHDDDQLVSALESILFDDELNARLRAECAGVPRTNWADYAASLWEFFVRN